MTAIASAAPMIAPAPAPAAPANGSAGAGPNAAGGGAENGEFARQLERAHQNRDAAAEPARPEGTRKAGDSARSRREAETTEADASKANPVRRKMVKMGYVLVNMHKYLFMR